MLDKVARGRLDFRSRIRKGPTTRMRHLLENAITFWDSRRLLITSRSLKSAHFPHVIA